MLTALGESGEIGLFRRKFRALLLLANALGVLEPSVEQAGIGLRVGKILLVREVGLRNAGSVAAERAGLDRITLKRAGLLRVLLVLAGQSSLVHILEIRRQVRVGLELAEVGLPCPCRRKACRGTKERLRLIGRGVGTRDTSVLCAVERRDEIARVVTVRLKWRVRGRLRAGIGSLISSENLRRDGDSVGAGTRFPAHYGPLTVAWPVFAPYRKNAPAWIALP